MRKVVFFIVIFSFLLLVSCKNETVEPQNEEINKVTLDFKTDEIKLEIKESHMTCGYTLSKEQEDENGTYVLFKVKINPYEGYVFSKDLEFEWIKEEKETAFILDKNITETLFSIDFKKYIEKGDVGPVVPDITAIDKITYTFSSKSDIASLDNDNLSLDYSSSINKDKENNKIIYHYEIVITPKDGFEFKEDIELKRNKDSDEDTILTFEEKSSKSIRLVFEKEEMVLFEIHINLDTLNYEVSSSSEYYKSEIVKPLDYIYITTKVTMNIKPSEDLKFIVNDKEIDNTKYKIELIEDKYVLTYRIDDPNWTPYY